MTRKNAGGSQNPGTAGTAADIWTILATAQLAGLNPVTYLTAYLDECGRHGGKPLSGEALARSLPWNASPEDLRTWAQPPPNRKTPDRNTATGVAASDRHAEFRRALSQDFRVLTSAPVVCASRMTVSLPYLWPRLTTCLTIRNVKTKADILVEPRRLDSTGTLNDIRERNGHYGVSSAGRAHWRRAG